MRPTHGQLFKCPHAEERTVNQESIDIWRKSFEVKRKNSGRRKQQQITIDILREIREDNSIMKQERNYWGTKEFREQKGALGNYKNCNKWKTR